MSIIGTHALFYTPEPEALRAMLRDVFGFPHVDAGDGWLIFRLPPAELGVHPAEGAKVESGGRHQLAFMCDDIHATVRDLRARGVSVQGEPKEEGFGVTVMLRLPGGVEAMLYEPRHAMAIQPSAPPRPAISTILREILSGAAPEAAYLLNAGDRGLLASLDALSADAASSRADGRSSVAAHVDHVRYRTPTAEPLGPRRGSLGRRRLGGQLVAPAADGGGVARPADRARNGGTGVAGGCESAVARRGYRGNRDRGQHRSPRLPPRRDPPDGTGGLGSACLTTDPAAGAQRTRSGCRLPARVRCRRALLANP